MSTRLQVQVKATSIPTPSFLPVRTGLLGRKYTFGGTPGLTGEFTESRGKRLVSQPPLLQPKLAINQPNDRYEQEADRVAEQVMRMPEPRLQRQVEPEEEEETLQAKPLAGQITPLVQRQVEPEEEEEEPIQTKQYGGQTRQIGPSLQAQIRSLRRSGQPLPESIRAFFEPRFGYDFSQVRVHTDTQAAKSARAVNARAYTVGWNIVFGTGRYSPETAGGRELLAHELAHVIQQGAERELLQRSVASEYPRIRSNLSYGILDWAIRDYEAREVLDILEALSDQDLIDTYFQMEVDGLWSRLQSNVPSDARSTFETLTERINRLTTITELTPSDQDFVRDICTFFFPDNPPDCVNREVANVALEMVVRAKSRCSELMDIVPRPPAVPSLFWLLRQVGAPAWRRVRRQGRTYEICRRAVSWGFRSVYEVAQISCHV